MCRSDIKKIFHEPVPVEEVPDYLTIIKTPMDFATMQAKVDAHDYTDPTEFEVAPFCPHYKDIN
jgi:hypothetical protein